MSRPFTTVTSVAAPMIEDNIDTDIIIPSREMRSTGKCGLAAGLFAGRRYLPGSREPDPDFILNRVNLIGAEILLAGENFGCGSSREHAVWALAEYGIRAVIAPSFSPIFAGNAVRGGVLPLVLPKEAVLALAAMPGKVSIDLPRQAVIVAGSTFDFAIDSEAKAMLIDGLDAIELTMKHASVIEAWQERNRAARPWVYLDN